MILQGWPVLLTLLICSILSLAVAWDRWRTFRKAKASMPEAVRRIVHRMMKTPVLQEREIIAGHEIAKWVAPLEIRLGILGTVASIAPFVGLLGTVIGIMKAFRAVSQSLGGGPSVVANGIAEALVTTAMGLVVAIPALVAYNYFSRRLAAMEQQIELAVGDHLSGAV
ncbi:MAG: MotA/TolQ/ExbB proton channel family protein [Elusimicrobia bacterium]|nr:MotA/TolQ/ExbB proton channel family protein [Elusimicrobiota bacterium]